MITLANDIEAIQFPDSATVHNDNRYWPAKFLHGTPLVFLDSNAEELSSALKDWYSSLFGFSLFHELKHYEDLMRLAPFQCMIWNSLLSTLRLIRYLHREDSRVLRIENKRFQRVNEPICKVRSQVRYVGNNQWKDEELALDVIMEGLALEPTLRRSEFKQDVKLDFWAKAFSEQLVFTTNKNHFYAFLLFKGLDETFHKMFGDGFHADYVVPVSINIAPMYSPQGLNKARLCQTLESVRAGSYIDFYESSLGFFCWIVERPERASTALDLKEQSHEIWLEFFHGLYRYIEETLEEVRPESYGYIPLIGKLVIDIFDMQKYVGQKLEVVEKELDGAKSICFSLPLILSDGSLAFISRDLDSGPTTSELKSELDRAVCSSWIHHLFERRIYLWFLKGGALECPLYNWMSAAVDNKDRKTYLSRLCQAVSLGSSDSVEPSRYYCAVPGKEINVREIEKKRKCGFWDKFFKRFIKFDKIIQ